MISAIMLLVFASAVALTGICTPISINVSPNPTRADVAPYSIEVFSDYPINWDTPFTDLEVNSDMTSDHIKDAMRQRIVEKSIYILRSHGKSDEEIRDMLLKDFRISEEKLDELLAAK